ncbi:Phosphatidate phosphatase APP1 [Mesonia phycicola]|uniref:Phosphatidate phosphatase APP1 n=1 Tax=Mesonia phycicola TaxID=579105 RepID=A0A1M6G7X0_9FLAO|nr:phosphatase domain-containing protein [Mesonia phycicola]SHJ06018.1 Phosphatidate phosphatase APP1 [Mesonia phycicola]
MIKRIKKLFGRYKNFEQILITPYRSYATSHHLYILGRVLDNKPLEIKQEQNFLNTIKNTYKQFDSFEIPQAEVEVKLPDSTSFFTVTNEEGYFTIDVNTKENLCNYTNSNGWLNYELFYRGKMYPQTVLLENPFRGELLIPDSKAEYGVISDIDDTILHTGVTSFLKWRLLKNSLFTNAYKRIPLKGASALYQKLAAGTQNSGRNPVFYLSNSPWNLYEYLKLFLDHHQFPKGPILLRNFRTPFDRSLKPEKPHKQKEIINILKTYPQLKFILIGDSGEHDASIYTDIAAQYPDKILAIYLRSVKHKGRMQRVQSILDNFKTTPVLLVNTSLEAEEHARSQGYIN